MNNTTIENKLVIYNTITRKLELFEPIDTPYVGMYVCGPTVYSDAHLGHARPAITFDLMFRYLQYLGYKVRYIRNITDVGHLVADADEGEDKIAKRAKLERIEPMEVVQKYTVNYHHNMEQLNVLPPSIEPRASAHIIEQLALIDKIFENGFAYEKDGSVYFNVERYSKDHPYGKLSGRILEDLISNTRDLEGQSEKQNPADFALWKKAAPEHIMRWPSKWSDGFPGWHLECSAMSVRYLGQKFDIHGGGMDLLFPHHECELAQSVAGLGHETVKYWIHNNMITINGQKMGKSLGNFITLDQLFSGEHQLLVQAYNPMTIRFFILQAHYRSQLDFSNEALQAAEKGLQRLFAAYKTLDKIKPSNTSSFDVKLIQKNCFDAMNDDLNTPVLIAHLFDGVKYINSVYGGTETISEEDLNILKSHYNDFIFKILGLKDQENNSKHLAYLKDVVDLLLNLRLEAKAKKDFGTADKIRTELTKIGFEIRDKKDGFEWEIKD
jgi:cysteinyl-tRNA synthetase